MNKSNFFSTLYKYKKRTAIIDDNLNKKNFGELLNDSHLFRRTDFKKKVVLIFCGNNYETITRAPSANELLDRNRFLV